MQFFTVKKIESYPTIARWTNVTHTLLCDSNPKSRKKDQSPFEKLLGKKSRKKPKKRLREKSKNRSNSLNNS